MNKKELDRAIAKKANEDIAKQAKWMRAQVMEALKKYRPVKCDICGGTNDVQTTHICQGCVDEYQDKPLHWVKKK
jgi:recombinational DNA repair protein RecR